MNETKEGNEQKQMTIPEAVDLLFNIVDELAKQNQLLFRHVKQLNAEVKTYHARLLPQGEADAVTPPMGMH